MHKFLLGTGVKFPLRFHGDGAVAMSSMEMDIEEAIRIILGTGRGERVMRPDFGCGIHDLVFAPINTGTRLLVRDSVTEALTKYEPRIVLLEVDVSVDEELAGKLQIDIHYRVRETNNEFNLVYPFYLKEGRP